MVSLNELCDRPPRKLADGEVIDIGGKRIRHIDTPHVPHNWEARVLFEETTKTLLCGDLFTHIGDGPALTDNDIVGPALAAEDLFRATALTIITASTIRRLATLEPQGIAAEQAVRWIRKHPCRHLRYRTLDDEGCGSRAGPRGRSGYVLLTRAMSARRVRAGIGNYNYICFRRILAERGIQTGFRPAVGQERSLAN